MPEDDASRDDSSPTMCTFTAAELKLAPLFGDPAEVCCSRPVWTGTNSDRCVWHADQADKPPEELAATVEDDIVIGARVPETNLTGVPFPEGVWLSGADLSGANLEGVDFSGANLFGADLSKARLLGADLTDANIANAHLTGANLRDADLSGATFQAANLSRSNLFDADLSGADLQEADLVGADLWAADLSAASLQAADLQNALLAETTLIDVSLARSTKIDDPETRIEEEEDLTIPQAGVYDIIARTNHELRAAYSDNGLIGRARRARVRERNARRKEALAEKSWRGTVTWGWSLLSKVFTGYGVQLRWIVLMMFLLYLGSAGVYWWQGMALNRGLYYSVVTFTTSPPTTPSPGIATAVAGIETFAGTAAIVLLGYVLGTRERV